MIDKSLSFIDRGQLEGGAVEVRAAAPSPFGRGLG